MGATLYVATNSVAIYVLKCLGSARPVSPKQIPSSGIQVFECSLPDAVSTGRTVSVPAEGSTPQLRTCTSQPGRALVCLLVAFSHGHCLLWSRLDRSAQVLDPRNDHEDITCPVKHQPRLQRRTLPRAVIKKIRRHLDWFCPLCRQTCFAPSRRDTELFPTATRSSICIYILVSNLEFLVLADTHSPPPRLRIQLLLVQNKTTGRFLQMRLCVRT